MAIRRWREVEVGIPLRLSWRVRAAAFAGCPFSAADPAAEGGDPPPDCGVYCHVLTLRTYQGGGRGREGARLGRHGPPRTRPCGRWPERMGARGSEARRLSGLQDRRDQRDPLARPGLESRKGHLSLRRADRANRAQLSRARSGRAGSREASLAGPAFSPRPAGVEEEKKRGPLHPLSPTHDSALTPFHRGPRRRHPRCPHVRQGRVVADLQGHVRLPGTASSPSSRPRGTASG